MDNLKESLQVGSDRAPDCVIRSLSVSCSPDRNYLGEKNYRSVFRLQEINPLYVDLRVLNRQNAGSDREVTVTLRLFWFDGEKAVCVAEKSGRLKIQDSWESSYEEVFRAEDLGKFVFREGVYRVTADIGENRTESEDLYLLPDHGETGDYCHVVHAGIDRCCEETEEESNARLHSFRMLKAEKLKDIRFYLLAQNLLSQEWVYEFIIRVLNRDGSLKVERRVKSGQYVKDPAGKSMLCFAVDLGDDGPDFWQRGEYTLMASCFGQLVLTLAFSVADEDVPYAYDPEIAEAAGQPFQPQSVLPVYSPEGKEEVLDRLYRLVGLRKVKEEITRISEYASFIRLRQENGFSDSFPGMHLIFTGNPGTGKNTVAGMIGELFCKLGVLADGNVHRFGRNDLVHDGTAAEEQTIRQALAASAGGVMFVDQAGDLFNPGDPDDRGVVALHVLTKILVQENPAVVVILADEADEMTDMLTALPDLKKAFPRQLCFEDYTPEELMEIARGKLEKIQYRFTPSAEEKFFRLLQKAYTARLPEFSNGLMIDERLDDAVLRMSRRLMAVRDGAYGKDELMLITDADVEAEAEADPEKPLEKLRAMPGLEDLKQNLLHHLNYIYFIRERQKHGFSDVMPPLNMVFSGNPGTGKMTVAKMFGEIYHSLGILLRSDVVAHNAHNLVAESGVAPQQMAALLLDSAAGGILFLEDADVMPLNEYGVAVLEGLLASIPTDEAGETVVILAGYPDTVEKMIATHPALLDYFPYHFRFRDYTPEELMEIASGKLKEKAYEFHPKAREAFGELIRKVYERRDKRFGNALIVEKMVDLTIRNLSERTMKIREERELTRKEVTTIRVDDVPGDILDMPGMDRDIFNEEEIAGALADLDRMVGQDKLKKQVRDFVELARHYSRQGVKLSTRMSLQWCFTGNSAMGKGTVARIIGRLYKAMGIVGKGHVVHFNVEKLIGQMEDEAQRAIGEALAQSDGGILLFDEDSPKLTEAAGLKERVRAILMNQMAERPGGYMLIYAEPRQSVPGFNGNAEQMSEIINVVRFENYTRDELMVILRRRLEKEKMKLTATARRHMQTFITSLVSTEERTYASARLMRIVADLMVRNCLQRVARSRKVTEAGEVISVGMQDVEMFTEQFVAGLINERKRIGFI